MLAPCAPPASSRSNRHFLPDRLALVHPMRPPQPRLLPHLHHRTQFQTLSHSRIPTCSTILVLHPHPTHRVSALDHSGSVGGVFGHYRIPGEQNRPIGRIAVELFAFFCLLFFSASKSKLPGYILPAIPTIGLLLARIVQTNKLRYRKSFVGSGLVGALLFFLTAVFAALVLSGCITVHSNGMAIVVLGFVSFCFALANLFLIFVRWQRTLPSQIPLPPLAAPPVLVAVILSHFLLMIFFPYDPSGRTLTYEIRPEIAARPDLFIGKMNRGKHYSLNFYLKKEIPDWDQKSPRTGLLLMESKNCSAIVPAPYTCSNEPFEFYASGIFGYQISRSDSLPRPGTGRQPRQEK